MPSSRSSSAIWTPLRPMRKKVGERCNIVTCFAVPAIAGTTAVAPEPITSTRLSV